MRLPWQQAEEGDYFTPPSQRRERGAGEIRVLSSVNFEGGARLETADFSRLADPYAASAFWAIGRDFYWGGASQVLQEVRGAAGFSGGAFRWDRALLQDLSDRVRGSGGSPPPLPGPADGSRVSAAWLRAALSVAYGGGGPVGDVRLPGSVILPDYEGADYPPPSSSLVSVVRNVDLEGLPGNPFGHHTNVITDIDDFSTTRPTNDGDGTLWVVGGLLAAVAIGGK